MLEFEGDAMSILFGEAVDAVALEFSFSNVWLLTSISEMLIVHMLPRTYDRSSLISLKLDEFLREIGGFTLEELYFFTLSVFFCETI